MKAIPRGSVDFIFDTTGQAMQFLSLTTPQSGMIISISTNPSGNTLATSSFLRRPEKPQLPWFVWTFLTLTDGISKLRARRWGVHYEYIFLESNAKDLDLLSGWIEEAKVTPIVGSRADFNDIARVRALCETVYKAKGGLGKAIIDVVQK